MTPSRLLPSLLLVLLLALAGGGGDDSDSDSGSGGSGGDDAAAVYTKAVNELDHLDGVLFLDRVDSLTSDVFRRQTYG